MLAGQLPLEVGRTCSLGVYRPMRMQAGLVHCYVMEKTALPEELAAAAASGEKPKARYFKIAAAEAAGSGLVPLGMLYVAADGRLVGFDVPGPGGTAETFRLAAAPEKKP